MYPCYETLLQLWLYLFFLLLFFFILSFSPPPPLQQLLDKKIEEFTFDSNSILEDRVLEKTKDRIEVRSSS